MRKAAYLATLRALLADVQSEWSDYYHGKAYPDRDDATDETSLPALLMQIQETINMIATGIVLPPGGRIDPTLEADWWKHGGPAP